jgi:tRNA A-37 threonylcarbamoyl transferase component Bud32
VRFVFTPPADQATGLLTLPWSVPLEDWRDDRLVEIRQRGISRHVVRFVYDDGTLYALKELSERLARREYRVLRSLAVKGVPAVEVVGITVDLQQSGRSQPDADAILVTRFLSYATTYRAVFSHPRGIQPVDGLLDALVELLARLHLSGFFWGDCSLSNTLFRHDAGTLEAYLVDAETSEEHPTLSDGQRDFDVELAVERIFGAAPGRCRPAGDRRRTAQPLRLAMAGADPRGDPAPRGAAVPHRGAAAPTQQARLRRRRDRADRNAGG